MLAKETAINVKGIIEDIYKQYGCKDAEVSAVYQNWNGGECKLTENRDIRPAKVMVNRDGTGIILINSEDPFLGDRFFVFVDEVMSCLKGNGYSITKTGYLYDCFMVEFTYK